MIAGGAAGPGSLHTWTLPGAGGFSPRPHFLRLVQRRAGTRPRRGDAYAADSRAQKVWPKLKWAWLPSSPQPMSSRIGPIGVTTRRPRPALAWGWNS